MRSYRDFLTRRKIEPLVIERTTKFGGDLVLASSCLPASRVPAGYRPRDTRGRFVGRGR